MNEQEAENQTNFENVIYRVTTTYTPHDKVGSLRCILYLPEVYGHRFSRYLWISLPPFFLFINLILKSCIFDFLWFFLAECSYSLHVIVKLFPPFLWPQLQRRWEGQTDLIQCHKYHKMLLYNKKYNTFYQCNKFSIFICISKSTLFLSKFKWVTLYLMQEKKSL